MSAPVTLTSKLRSSQRQLVAYFVRVTGADEGTAMRCLHGNDWREDVAVSKYFQSPESYACPRISNDTRRIEGIFLRYCDPDNRYRMGPVGLERLLRDLGLDPLSRIVLVFAWRMQASAHCEFSRAEFIEGMSLLNCCSLGELKTRLRELDGELSYAPRFKAFYEFAFDYAKDPTQKNLDLEVAVPYWKILLRGKFAQLDLWIQFVTEKQPPLKQVSRDTWNLLLEFAQTVNPTLSNYAADEAWPVLIDEFVDWARPRVAPDKGNKGAAGQGDSTPAAGPR